MKTLRQQVADALWYLERPGQSPGDEAKAIEILGTVARGRKGGDELVKKIRESEPTINPSGVPWQSLKGLVLVIGIGHEAGGGASGERTWNTKVAKVMKGILESHGAIAHIYFHKVKSYTLRQNRFAAFCKKVGAFLCWELHYDAFTKASANGHHFKYRGAKKFAVFTQEEFSQHYPQSVARNSYGDGPGLHHALKGNGSGFLKKMPCWAMLPEPFFNSNPAERAFFKPKINEIAFVYCIGATRFAQSEGK
jgi:N-acetylmuramoyl-L-alanine amidase